MALKFFPANAKENLFGGEVTTDKRSPGVYLLAQHILILGQQLSTGKLTNNTPTLVSSAHEARQRAGAGSELAIMAERVFRGAPTIPISLAAIPEPSGAVKAETEITVTGASTSAGSLYIYIKGDRYEVNLPSGSAVNSTATAVKDAVDLNLKKAFDVSVSAGVITLTAKWGGVTANDIDVDIDTADNENGVAGVNIAVTNFSGGTGTPDITDALAKITDDDDYTVIVHPYIDSSNLDKLNELKDRWKPQLNKPVVCIGAEGGGPSDTFNDRNSRICSLFPTQDSPSMRSEVAAGAGAVVADTWGRDPSLQMYARILAGIYPPKKSSRWTWAQRNAGIEKQLSSLKVIAGKFCISQARNTLETLDNGGEAQEADKYLNCQMVVGSILYDWDRYMEANFSDAKLSNDGQPQPAGQKIMTPSQYRGLLIARYEEVYIARGWCENLDGFKETIIVTRNDDNPNRLDAEFQIYIIGNLRVHAFKLGYDFA